MYPFFISLKNLWLLVNYDKKTQQIAKWLANAFMLVSAIGISVSVAAALAPVTYLGFLLAHIIWAFFAWKIDDRALLAQFIFLMPIDLYAMYIRL
jgi:ABC-type enterochelin transport system permease subunit